MGAHENWGVGGGRGLGGRERDRRSKRAGCKGNRGEIISKHFVIEKRLKGGS